jgi:hypothetical protein
MGFELTELSLQKGRFHAVNVGKQWFCRYKVALFLAHREAKLS